MNNASTLSKILNGINSTLNIANKAIPIYKESKPILNTLKNTYSNIRNNKTEINKLIKLLKLKKQLKKDSINITPINIPTETIKENNSNNPKFFI